MGKKEMRMNRLVEIINSRGYIPIKEIAQLLHVSEMTVRRDLAAVEKSGLVKNVNGVLVSNPRTQLFAGEDGVNFIRSIRANKLFISAAGIHEDLGISCANSYEVPIKRAILQSAKQHILVADSSKFGVVRSAYFCDLEDIDIVITDTGLSPEWRNILQERGVTLYQV